MHRKHHLSFEFFPKTAQYLDIGQTPALPRVSPKEAVDVQGTALQNPLAQGLEAASAYCGCACAAGPLERAHRERRVSVVRALWAQRCGG